MNATTTNNTTKATAIVNEIVNGVDMDTIVHEIMNNDDFIHDTIAHEVKKATKKAVKKAVKKAAKRAVKEAATKTVERKATEKEIAKEFEEIKPRTEDVIATNDMKKTAKMEAYNKATKIDYNDDVEW